jgi:hypothetical protein
MGLSAGLASATVLDGAPLDATPAIRQYLDHSKFAWSCERSEHFQFCFEAKSLAAQNIRDLKIIAEDNRNAILELVGVPDYDPLIYAFFVNSRSQMKRLIGAKVDGRARPNQHATFYVINGPRTLAHEISHEILSNLWGAAEPWIEEGFAVYATESPILDDDCRAYVKAHRLLPLDQIVNSKWDSSMYSADITYTELGGFVKFLERTYGLARIAQVWQQGALSIPQVYGKSVAALEQEWLAALAHPPAERSNCTVVTGEPVPCPGTGTSTIATPPVLISRPHRSSWK